LRVVVSGFPELQGETLLARRRFAKESLDHLRTALMWEPRGHADMYGCLLTSPVTPGAHLAVLFLHNEGYSTMCGHGIIAVTTVALEAGLLPRSGNDDEEVRIDTPAGLVTARARVEQGRVKSVAFRNVPSFVLSLDERMRVSGLGEIRYDLAFGGAFYAYVRADEVGLSCTPRDLPDLIEIGTAIKHAVTESRSIRHPEQPDLGFLYGTIFTGPSLSSDANSRSVCVFAEGEVDRSPTGTGVSGRLAILFARGEIRENERYVVESIVGTRFTGRVVATTQCGSLPAVVPEIEGSAYITGQSEFLLSPDDALRYGFFLR
jgi:trans-L-3-hydroxyproline dehydratase